jgi:hypothetical protein
MANYHVLEGVGDGNAYRVTYHIAVPGTGNNRAGTQWRAALANSRLRSVSDLPDGDGTGGTISAAEKASLASGALFEYTRQEATRPGETANQFRDRLDAGYPALVALVQAELQSRLSYFGFIRDVP